MLSKCFGIVSWLPNDPNAREVRSRRLESLLDQLCRIFPEIPVLIVAQNYKGFSPKTPNSNILLYRYNEGLGILNARKELRRVFLTQTDFQYIILLDDDAVIETTEASTKEFLDKIDGNPNGFCFRPAYKYPDMVGYEKAQLNLCAISRHIMELEDLPVKECLFQAQEKLMILEMNCIFRI